MHTGGRKTNYDLRQHQALLMDLCCLKQSDQNRHLKVFFLLLPLLLFKAYKHNDKISAHLSLLWIQLLSIGVMAETLKRLSSPQGGRRDGLLWQLDETLFP